MSTCEFVSTVATSYIQMYDSCSTMTISLERAQHSEWNLMLHPPNDIVNTHVHT